MANQFCRFLSNGYSFSHLNNFLEVKPCCWYKGGVAIDKNLQQRIGERSLINHWTDGCLVCHKQEIAGQKSFRQSSFEIIPDVNSNIPLAIDINLDITCNAACVICGPDSSTFWEKQLGKKVFKIKNNNSIAEHIDCIEQNFDLTEIRRIKFFGGEPLITDTHIKVLKKIANPEKCEIWYTTNASVSLKTEVLDLWSKFKLVFFEASIDGIGNRFDYIRWPLKWEKVSNNLLDLKEIGPKNLLFRVNHTLNPFNIFYYDELENWVQNNLSTNRLGDPTEINIHPCWGTWDLSKTPMDLRIQIHNKYPDSLLSRLLSNLDSTNYTSIIDFTKKHDISRNKLWTETFPEIVKYFP